MRVFLGVLSVFFLSATAPAQESESIPRTTYEFNVPGGKFDGGTMWDFLSRTQETPAEIRFVITGIDIQAGGDPFIGFFFRNGTGPEVLAQSPGDDRNQIRLRFRWNKEKQAAFPNLYVTSPEDEIRLHRMDLPIALNEPATLTIARHETGQWSLIINGRTAPLRFNRNLTTLGVYLSGAKARITMPALSGDGPKTSE